MKYKAIIFDVSDTLVEYSPNWAQIFGDKIRSLGIEVSEGTIWKTNNAVYWANGEQTRREQNGARHATPEELSALMDEVALSCVDYPRERFIVNHSALGLSLFAFLSRWPQLVQNSKSEGTSFEHLGHFMHCDFAKREPQQLQNLEFGLFIVPHSEQAAAAFDVVCADFAKKLPLSGI